jgi:hypothetical protein
MHVIYFVTRFLMRHSLTFASCFLSLKICMTLDEEERLGVGLIEVCLELAKRPRVDSAAVYGGVWPRRFAPVSCSHEIEIRTLVATVSFCALPVTDVKIICYSAFQKDTY